MSNPRIITWFNGDEWQIKPIMTEAEFKQSPAAQEYRHYKTYASHSKFLNEYLEEPENHDLLRRA